MVVQCQREKKGDEGLRQGLAHNKCYIKKMYSFIEIRITFLLSNFAKQHAVTCSCGCVSAPQMEGVS